MIEVALKDKTQDNPIYRADREFKLREAVIKKEGDSDFSYLLDKIDSLDNKVSLLTKKNNYRLWGSLDYNKYLNNDIALQVVSDYLNNKEENNKDK